MSIRFAIRNTAGEATKEGDTVLRFTGVSEPFNRSSSRSAKKVGEFTNGDPKLVFNTGLDETKVSMYNWYNEEEKKQVKKMIKELKPKIQEAYGGADIIDPGNKFFWKEDRSVSRLLLTNYDIDVFYDTEKPSHALLYLSIIGGAFAELVAPTKEWAIIHQIPHYLILETDSTSTEEQDQDVTRSDAHAMLADLRKNEGKEALYMLAWCLQYDTNAFGAYSHSVSEKELVSYHIKYIDGKLVTKRKKNMPKTFISYAEKWKGQQTRPLIFAEAYIKAGEYYSFINQREKKYVTADGTVLGNTIAEAVENIMKPKFNDDFKKLRDQVEAKWNE